MSDYFDRVERQLIRSVEAGVPRSRRPAIRFEQLAYVAALLVVVAVVAVFVGLRGQRQTGSPSTSRGTALVFSALPAGPGARLVPALDRSVVILRKRFDSILPGAGIRRVGDEIVVTDRHRRDLAKILALSAPGQLSFYDWEADALVPTGAHAGATVASRLEARDPAALLTSQGDATLPTGSPGAGSLGLYQAVELGHRQAVAPGIANESHAFYLFGAPGSSACEVAARARGAGPRPGGGHCLLAGPDNSVANLRVDLGAAFGGQVTLAQGRLITLRGTVVLQAVDPNPGTPVPVYSPRAQFYVLRGVRALGPGALTRARASTDSTGSPDVEFDFTSAGGRAFTSVTDRIAKRGFRVSSAGETLDQHFAIVLDGELLSVPSIAYNIYPDGVSEAHGADIAAAFTRVSARELATLLRFGPLPVRLVLR